MSDRFLTVKQPWASLIMAGGKDVENRPKPVPSTLPQWAKCERCGDRASIHPGYQKALVRRDPILTHSFRCEGQMLPDGPFPFRLWIHAGQGLDRASFRDQLIRESGECYLDGLDDGPDLYLPRGVLLGHVTVTGCHNSDDCKRIVDRHWNARTRMATYETGHCSTWAQPDAYHWTLADPVALPEPIPMKGMLGLPFLPDDVRVAALAQLEGATA